MNKNFVILAFTATIAHFGTGCATGSYSTGYYTTYPDAVYTPVATEPAYVPSVATPTYVQPASSPTYFNMTVVDEVALPPPRHYGRPMPRHHAHGMPQHHAHGMPQHHTYERRPNADTPRMHTPRVYNGTERHSVRRTQNAVSHRTALKSTPRPATVTRPMRATNSAKTTRTANATRQSRRHGK